MRKVSELVGIVTQEDVEYNRTIDGEVFNTIEVNFFGTVIPVLYSKYVVERRFDKGSKILVIGTLMSDVRKGCLPVFYFYANSIELADADYEVSNTVYFSCEITKVKKFCSNDRSIDILPLVGADASPLDTTSVLYLCANKAHARRLKNKPRGYTIEGKGYLKKYKDVYEIMVTDIFNLETLVPRQQITV